ncbi:hypothetical protein TH63_04350 [Rufibacter radiotolerans]|uniref:Lipoprotein n=1 Tax=Rufibacter radiotolerans TaxID=1379910 RepID=A0A0H4W3M0_9BACT|nr:hypothetical protein [Rufibacter radiotolerans]AKQ45036.1 hypothetical protein TH63_04350 [Rufibacter radiotolerans]
MKKILILVFTISLLSSCKETKRKVEEKPFPSFTYNGNKYLRLPSSEYYPSDNRPFEEEEKPYGELTIDSSGNFELVKVKFWMLDSVFKRLAQKENLSYSKTYLLDTTQKERIFDFSNGFEVKPVGDTAYFSLKINNLNATKQELKEKWTIKINCHFEDKNGVSVDTFFVSNFNAKWMN